MLDVDRDEIVSGPLGRSLVALSLPLFAQNLVQVANQIVDLFWLGRLSEDAVAAVGLVVPLIGILFAVLLVSFVGTQVLVSQRAGDDDFAGARRGTFNGVVLALGLGATIGLVAFVLREPLVSLLDPEPSVLRLGAAYLGVYALGLPASALADTMEGGFVGVGDSRGSLYLNALAVGINIVLDPFLIFGWGPFPALGIRGAALANVLGYAAGFLLAVGFVVRGRNRLVVTREALSLHAGDLREIVDIGSPNTGQRLGQQAVRVLIVGVISAVGGTAGLAAYTVGARIATIAFVPAHGLQQAAQSVVGQNLGARKPMRAGRTTWIGAAIAAGALSVIGAVQWLVPGALVDLFVPGMGTASAALTVDYLRILAYGYPAIGATYLFLAGFNGARRTRTSMVATLLQYWVVRLPIAAAGALLLGFGVHAVFWAVTISNVVAAVGAGGYYRWRQTRGMLEAASEIAGSTD